MHNIVLIGPQGSGKGTQSSLLAAKLGIPVIAVGKLFRAEIAKQTGLGKAMEEYILRGDRVPSMMVNQAMSERISESDTENGMMLDGYPRTTDQAEALDKILESLGREVTHVIYLKLSDEVAMRRLSGRRVCTNPQCEANYHVDSNPPKKDPEKCDRCGSPLHQREDDTPEAIKRRLELYHADTEPLIKHYTEKGLLHSVDAEQGIDAVNQVLLEVLGEA